MNQIPSSTHRVASHVISLPRSGIRDFFEMVQGMPDVISLGVGEPDFVTPWHIREAAIYSLERGATSYTSNLGQPKLRKAISEYIAREFSVSYSPQSEIIVTVGVSEALDLAIRAITNPGDEIIYHEPCYVSYSPSIVLAHGVAKAVSVRPEDEFKLRPDALEQAITPKTKALLLNFPTNPTGGTMDKKDLQAIADVVIKHDLLVITDEIYGELTFESGHSSIAALPGMAERTILLHGVSKAFAMTGFRIGFACGPSPLIEAMMKIHQYSMLCAGITSQEAAHEALSHGKPAMEAMRAEYRIRRDYVVAQLCDMGLPCHRPKGSFYSFPSVEKTGLSSQEFAQRLLKEESVACVPGEAFGVSGAGHVRCCFATSLEKLEIAMKRMRAFLARL